MYKCINETGRQQQKDKKNNTLNDRVCNIEREIDQTREYAISWNA